MIYTSLTKNPNFHDERNDSYYQLTTPSHRLLNKVITTESSKLKLQHPCLDDACSVVSKEYKFYFIDEKGARARNSGLLIAEGTSGSGVSSAPDLFYVQSNLTDLLPVRPCAYLSFPSVRMSIHVSLSTYVFCFGRRDE